jgi:hypothetical protein
VARRQNPPPVASKPDSNSTRFRWQPGSFKQFAFQFSHGSKYLIKNHQPIESNRFDLVLCTMDAVTADMTGYLEAILQQAFDPQKSVIVYSPLVISPPFSEANFVTPVALSEIDSFLFANNTFYIDVRIPDSLIPSNGVPALPGSTVPAPTSVLPFAGLQTLGWGS